MQARQGLKVGKCMLFFGARYKQEPQSVQRSCSGIVTGAAHGRCILQEWLYREEFESYEKEGVLCKCTRPSRASRLVCTRGILAFEQCLS